MNPRRPHAQIHLPPLDAGYALTLVDIFERAITAIWNAHGDSMANLRASAAITPCPATSSHQVIQTPPILTSDPTRPWPSSS